jgi:alpha-L-fucosidase
MTKQTPARFLTIAVIAANSICRVLLAEDTNALGAVAAKELPPIAPGRFQPTDESLKQYQYPEWFRDAKLGFWSHWGPQAVPKHGDWYAKKLYIGKGYPDLRKGTVAKQDDFDYADHLARYGHPSEKGYKDIIPLWTAKKWDPDSLMALYKKAGAKYFVSMGTHHDNFFLWDSKLHRWNAVQMGPRKDVVGLWQKAAKANGLPFGVSEHLGASYTWLQTAHGADAEGAKKGVPYDGNDPKYQDLYHKKLPADDHDWLTKDPENQKEWNAMIRELVDTYHPDLLYSDSKLPFGDVGRNLIANFYNENESFNNGKLTAVYNCKEPSEGRFVQDLERGVKDDISPYPWQTDTSIGDWFYRNGQKYKSASEVTAMLCDIVSKNGNLLLNIVQTPEGDLEPDVLAIVDGISKWTAINGEGIYASRPWKISGENPPPASPTPTPDPQKGEMFNEGKQKLTAQNIRFTTSKDGKTLYAFCLGEPQGDITIKTLGSASGKLEKPIASVSLFGVEGDMQWKQTPEKLLIPKPTKVPLPGMPVGFRITFKD